MKKKFRSFLFIPEGTEQANSPSNAILSLQKEALLVTCIVYSFCLKVVNRQLMEKEQEASESQEKVKRLTEEARTYGQQILRLQVRLVGW
jgi:hypothetical protein